MGNICTLPSGIHPQNTHCSAVKELIPVLIHSETKFVKMPLSFKEIAALKKSWVTAKKVWNEICTDAFAR